jgi:hypothetical protein
MVRISGVLLALMIITATSAEIPDPPLSETRLTIHTLLREDIFAGLLENDMQRLTRGEKNIQLLLQQRPEANAPLMGWRVPYSTAPCAFTTNDEPVPQTMLASV